MDWRSNPGDRYFFCSIGAYTLYKKVYRLYDLTGVPETFIINKKGDILLKIIGPRDWMKKPWLDYFDRIIGKTSLPQ